MIFFYSKEDILLNEKSNAIVFTGQYELKVRQFRNKTQKRIILFFLISHSIPFLMTFILMALEGSIFVSNSFFNQIIYVAFLSPIVAAIIIIYRYYSNNEKSDYFLSIIDFRRIPLKVFLFILLFPVFIRWLASVMAGQFVISVIQFDFSPQMSLSYAIMLLFFGPIPEELGWRGVALPALKARYGFQKAVLFLGFMWAIWHLPLFFFRETFQYQLGLFTPLFWSFMAGVFFTSIILGAIFNETKQSIFAVILFHYLDNLTGEAFLVSANAEILSSIIRGIIAMMILIRFGNRYASNDNIIMDKRF